MQYASIQNENSIHYVDLEDNRDDMERLLHRLRRSRFIPAEIQAIRRKISRLKEHEQDIAQSVSSPHITGLPGGKGRYADPTCQNAQSIIEHCQTRVLSYLRIIRRLTHELNDTLSLLDSLADTERQIIRLRYIENHTWAAVSLRVYLCERQCQRIAKKTLVDILSRAKTVEENDRGNDAEAKDAGLRPAPARRQCLLDLPLSLQGSLRYG